MSATDMLIWTLASIIPVVFWLIIYYKKDFKDPEPKKVLFHLFLFGMIPAVFMILLRHIAGLISFSIYLNGFIALVLFAFLEEWLKLIVGVCLIKKYHLSFNQLIDGLVYMAVVALGFAFIENGYYLYLMFQSGVSGVELGLTLFIRGFGLTFAHTLFSGLLGLVWAYAYFSKKITPFQKSSLIPFGLSHWFSIEVLSLHILRRNILINHPSRRGGHEKSVLVAEGVILSSFLHALFNGAISIEWYGQSFAFLVVPLVVLGILTIFYLFSKPFYHGVYRVI